MNSKLVFGAVALVSLAGAAQGQIRVAVVAGGSQMSGPGVAAQLNDSNVFNFSAQVVNPADVDTLQELANWDVVVLGDAGFNDDGYTQQMFEAVRDFMNAGGGVVTTGFYVYSNSNRGGHPEDEISPESLATGYSYWGNHAVTIIDGNHPVTQGISDFGPVGAAGETPQSGADNGATVLGNLGNGPGIIVFEDAGRSVYLGHAYLGNEGSYGSGNLRSGMADQLFEQAVWWASIPAPGTAAMLGLFGVAGLRRRR